MKLLAKGENSTSRARRKLENSLEHSVPFPVVVVGTLTGATLSTSWPSCAGSWHPSRPILHFLFFPPARWPSRPIIDRLLTWDNVESFVAFPFSVQIQRGGGGRGGGGRMLASSPFKASRIHVVYKKLDLRSASVTRKSHPFYSFNCLYNNENWGLFIIFSLSLFLLRRQETKDKARIWEVIFDSRNPF